MSRAVALIDMDCFYVQVEQREKKTLRGMPCAVVQGTGLLIAVSYEARDLGVTRGHRVKDAKVICPEIHLVNVPEPRGKADLTKYRDAGAEVITALSEFGRCVVERASIDEAYVDMTEEVNARLVAMETYNVTADQLPNTFVVGWEEEDNDETGKTGTNSGAVDAWLRNLDESDRQLAVAAIVTEEMRAAILRDCDFHCSAGIAHNKLLAKLVCSRHKPNKQTVLPQSAVNNLFQTTPVQKIRLLGGKLGSDIRQQLGVEFVAELVQFSEKQLQLEFGEKQGSWLYQVCRGVDNEPVKSRRLAKSIGCGKIFAGTALLDTEEKVQHWLRMMSLELEERLTKDKHENQREARLLTVRVENGSPSVDGSRSCPILHYTTDKLYANSLLLLRKFHRPTDSASGLHTWSPPIRSLYMSASKFEDLRSNTSSIKQFVFKPQSSPMCGSSTCIVRSCDSLHRSSASVVRSSDPLHGSSASVVRSSDPLYGSSASVVRSSDPLYGSSASVVRSSDPLYGSSASVVRSSDPLHGSSASVVRSSDPLHGSSASVVRSSNPLHGSSASVVTSAFLSGSSDTMSRSSDLRSGSLDLRSGSSACMIKSSDFMPELPSMSGSSAGKMGLSRDDDTSIYTLTKHQPRDRSHVSSSVQPQLNTHTDPGCIDRHITNYSCVDSPVSRLHQPQDDNCPAGHHNNDRRLGLCNDVSENDRSYQGQTHGLKRTEEIPTEDKIDVKHVKRECQIHDTAVGLDSAHVTMVMSEDNTDDSQRFGDTSGDTIQCHKCGVSVNVWEVPEHLDFHLAVELQETENSKSNGKRKSTDSGSHTTKRRNLVKDATTLHRFFEAS